MSSKTNRIFKLAVEQAYGHIIITDPEGKIVYANKAAQRITGYSEEEMLGKTPSLWGRQMSDGFYQEMWNVIKNQKQVFRGEVRNRRKSGELYDAEVTISPVTDDEGNIEYFVGLERDITEQKNYERTILESNTRLEALIENIGDGVVATDPEGRLTFINKEGTDMVGYAEEELKGKKWADDVPQIINEHGRIISEEIRPTLVAIRNKKKLTSKYYYVRKDGTKFPVSVTSSPILIDDIVVGAVTVFRDITREHEIDRMKTEFVSLASHQLRTPLSAIKWLCEILLGGDAGDTTDEQRDILNQIYKSNDRMIGLVNALLNISRIESGRIIIDSEPTDIKSLIDEVLTEIAPKVSEKKINLTTSLHESIPQVSIDPKLAKNAFQNLLTNAVKYTPEQGDVTVTLSKNDKDVIFQVTDTGIGIPKDQQERVFQRFFRAENAHYAETDGNGLGLYLVKAIVESLNGNVWFESEEGKGSTFWISLPLEGCKPKEGEVTIS